jgi:hypothetical protein
MSHFHSYAKLFLVVLFVGVAIFLESPGRHDSTGSIMGILSGLALVEALVIFRLETES